MKNLKALILFGFITYKVFGTARPQVQIKIVFSVLDRKRFVSSPEHKKRNGMQSGNRPTASNYSNALKMVCWEHKIFLFLLKFSTVFINAISKCEM